MDKTEVMYQLLKSRRTRVNAQMPLPKPEFKNQ